MIRTGGRLERVMMKCLGLNTEEFNKYLRSGTFALELVIIGILIYIFVFVVYL